MSIARIWNKKADNWLKGRQNLLQNLNRDKDNQIRRTIWMHCASLGEFEQGRPLIEKLKVLDPDLKVVLSFFSPSGYEVMKNYPFADLVTYLPLDTASNASKFIEIIQPNLVLWVKYEYWYHFLNQLYRRKIPVLLVSGIFRKKQPFFRFYGRFWQKMLNSFNHFFVQDSDSAELLQKIGRKNVSIAGDTRFDRVISISNESKEIPGIREFCSDKKVIVAGSTWEEDEVLLIHYARIHPEVRLIVAPHEIDLENLLNVKKSFSKSIFYADWVKLLKSETPENLHFNCLVIDNVGMLSTLYKYADVCYVGGGFGIEGVHNVLEPAVFYKPVLYGPEYEKYIEAFELIESGGSDEVKNAIDLEQALDTLLHHENKQAKWGKAAGEYVQSKSGATENIINFIYKKRLLTN